MPLPLIPIIANLAGQAANIGSTLYQNSQSKKWAQEQYQQQRADAITDWNRQNEYNSPQAQMERYRKAGLNPNLIYGGGNTSAGNAVQVQQANMQRPEFQAPQIDATGVLTSYYDTQLKKANLDLIKTQTEVSRETIALRAAETRAKMTSTERAQFDLTYQKQLTPYSLQAAELNVKQGQAKLMNQLTQNEIQTITKADTIAQAAQQVINMRKQALLQDASIAKSTAEKARIYKSIKLLDEQIKSAPVQRALQQQELEMLKQGIPKGTSPFQRAAAEIILPIIEQSQTIWQQGIQAAKEWWSPNKNYGRGSFRR